MIADPQVAQGHPRLAGAVRAVKALLLIEVLVFTVSTLPGVRGQPGFEPLLDGWLQGSAYVTAAVLCGLRIMGPREADRTAWAWIAAALALRAAGFVLFLAIVRELRPMPYPSAADAAWLMMPLLMLAGVVSLARSRDSVVTARIALDGLVGALACAAVGVAAMYGTLVDLTAPGIPRDQLVTNLAYPALDLMLLVAVVAIVVSFAFEPPRAVWALAAGLVGFAVVDSVFLYQSTQGSFRPGTLISSLALGSTALMAWAAWVPDRSDRQAATAGIPRLFLPALFATACVGVLVWGTAEPVPGGAVVLAASGLALAVARTLVTFREVASLGVQLHDQAERLTRSEATAREEAERLSAVLRGVTDYAIIGGSPAGVTFFSPGAERMLGYRADQVVGHFGPDLFHDREEMEARAAELGVSPPAEAFVAIPRSGSVETREWTYVRKDGSRFPVQLTVSALHDADGRLTEFLGVARDVSGEHLLAGYRRTRETIVQILGEERDLSRALEGAVRVIVEGMGWDVGVLWLASEGRLTCAALWARDESDAARLRAELAGMPLAGGEGLAGRVWSDGEATWVDDFQTYDGLTAAGDEIRSRVAHGMRATACLPIPEGGAGAPAGVLQVFSGQPAHPDDELLDLMTTIATTLGQHVERERAAALVAAARDEAERANRAKTEFISSTSHELRTPLNAILGFAQILVRDAADTSQRERAERIVAAGDHLLAVVDDLLDLGQIERGELRTVVEPVAVTDVLRDVLDLAQPLIAERGLALEIDAHGGIHEHVLADPQRLRQVVLNIVSNAIKYNRPAGRITIAFERPEDGWLRFAVTDTGPGVPEADLPRLFDAFDRLGAEQGGEHGTGLGLAVSRGLVDAMGGRIEARSAVGVGTTVYVDLPRTAAPEQEAAEAVPKVTAHGGATTPLHGTVLYIEDHPVNRQLVEAIFAGQPDVELVMATTGGAGIEEAQRRSPDLVLLDAQLPDLDGEAVLDALRSDVATAAIPIIVLSADATSERRQAFASRGVDAYVTKPLDIGLFLGEVGRVMARREPPDAGSRDAG